jgi:hypothetical protein
MESFRGRGINRLLEIKQTSHAFYLKSNILASGSQKITFTGKPLFFVSALQLSMTKQIFHEILVRKVDSM